MKPQQRISPRVRIFNPKRKLTLETIKEFKLGYAPLSDKTLSLRLVNYGKKKNIDTTKLIEYGFIKKTNQQNNFREISYFQPKYKSLNNFSH